MLSALCEHEESSILVEQSGIEDSQKLASHRGWSTQGPAVLECLTKLFCGAATGSASVPPKCS